MRNVIVLMSCYNGELYLKEQINTILSQKELMALCIRDDGSSDNSITIIKEIISNNHDTDIRIIEGDNIGVVHSFLELMKYAENNFPLADYYAFADQDDYWFPDKIEVAISYLRKTPNNKPALYLSQYQMADAMLKHIATPKLKANVWIESALVNNIATGCTMVMNRHLLRTTNRYSPHNITMHDYWVYLVALSIDADVYFDPVPHFLYRQHGRNAIGGFDTPFWTRWTLRLTKLFKPGKQYNSSMAKELLNGFSDLMSKKTKAFLKTVACPNRISNKIKLLFNSKMRGSSVDKTIRCKLLILTGKF